MSDIKYDREAVEGLRNDLEVTRSQLSHANDDRKALEARVKEIARDREQQHRTICELERDVSVLQKTRNKVPTEMIIKSVSVIGVVVAGISWLIASSREVSTLRIDSVSATLEARMSALQDSISSVKKSLSDEAIKENRRIEGIVKEAQQSERDYAAREINRLSQSLQRHMAEDGHPAAMAQVTSAITQANQNAERIRKSEDMNILAEMSASKATLLEHGESIGRIDKQVVGRQELLDRMTRNEAAVKNMEGSFVRSEVFKENVAVVKENAAKILGLLGRIAFLDGSRAQEGRLSTAGATRTVAGKPVGGDGGK